MGKEKPLIQFAHTIEGIGKRKVAFSFHGIDVYKCKPVVKHPGNDPNIKKAFDIYLICEDFLGEPLENGVRESRRIEIITCFQWLGPKQYRRVKTYIISKSPVFEAHFFVGFVMTQFLMKKLHYEIENWRD